MIAQLLDRDFLLDRVNYAARLHDQMAVEGHVPPEVAEAMAAAGVSLDEWRVVLADLKGVAERDGNKSSEPIERRAFIGRDKILSLLQSAIEEYYEQHSPAEVRTGAQGRGFAGGIAPVTDRELTPTAAALLSGEAQGFLEKFSKTDIGWASVLMAKAYAFGQAKHPFNPRPAEPFALSDTARIVLLGDWATGIPRARRVGEQIRALLLKESGKREQHVIHLGDVYYSGWPEEYRSRFFPYWPVRAGEWDVATSWCLNGNHDMYSGGNGYFNQLLGDPLFARQQRSSFFSLGNAHWLVLGLDSAYEDEALQEPQDAWALAQMRDSRRGNLLLTHHQPFSAYDKPSARLIPQLAPALDQGLVRGWFWGHEHRCTIYEPQHGVTYGRCVGHGGVPSYVDPPELPPKVSYAYRGSLSSGFETWARFGFAVLDFDGPTIRAAYFDENWRQAYEEQLTAQL